MATVSFFALAVLFLGVLSVVRGTDIIDAPDAAQAPGIVGMVVAVGVFAGILWAALRISRPVFRSTWVIAIATALAHLLAVGATVLFATGDFVTALAVSGTLVTGGVSVVLLVVAAVAAWGGIALRRTRARRPRWPWENGDSEEG